MIKTSLRIGLIQMVSEKGAVVENLRQTARYLEEAAEKGVDIVAFPEGSISGFVDPTRFPEAVLRLDGPEVGRFLKLTQGFPCTVLAGIIEENGRHKPYITQLIAREGQLLGYYRKRTIEDEEVLWFSAGNAPFVFDHRGLRIGTAICADIGNQPNRRSTINRLHHSPFIIHYSPPLPQPPLQTAPTSSPAKHPEPPSRFPNRGRP